MPATTALLGNSSGNQGNNPTERNAEATIHVRQLDDKVTDSLLLELMIQAGPVKNVYIPRDRITGNHYGYGFCEFRNDIDAAYAAKVFNMIKLYNKPIRVSQSNVDRVTLDVGANLFVGNLSPEVDEKLLHDTFSAFGSITETPYIMRDPSTEVSKGYGFVKFSSFEASDAAIAAMNGQYISNRPISVQYAFKKDGEQRERHGSEAERVLAASARESSKRSNIDLFPPFTMFADGPRTGRPLTPPPPPPMSYYPTYQQYPIQPGLTHPSTNYPPPPPYTGPVSQPMPPPMTGPGTRNIR